MYPKVATGSAAPVSLESVMSGGATTRVDFATKIKYPTVVGVGYGFKLTDTVRVEANAECGYKMLS